MKRLLFLCIISLLTLTGCAVGNKYDLANSVPEISHSSNQEVALGVQDSREFITNGDKTQDFIGLQRGGFGNPFDVSTQSGKPLAEDILNALAAGLEKQGYRISKVKINPLDSPEMAKSKLTSKNKPRSILISILQWKSDTMYSVALHYDFKANIYNKDGKLLYSNTVKGSDELGGNAWNPPAHAVKAVPQALTEKLDMLLDTPSASKILSGK